MGFYLDQVDREKIAAVHVERMDDLKAVADHCAGLRGIGATGSKEMKHVARVPEVLVMKYINDAGITWAQFIRDPKHAERFLADPALQAFRVWEGHL